MGRHSCTRRRQITEATVHSFLSPPPPLTPPSSLCTRPVHCLSPFTITAAPSICPLRSRREFADRKSDTGAPSLHNKGPFKRPIFRTTGTARGQGASRTSSPAEHSYKTTHVADALKVTFHSLAYLSICLLYTSPSPRDGLLSRMPSSA